MANSEQSPLKTSEAIALFPTFVWKYSLAEEHYKPLNERIQAKLAEMRPAQGSMPLSRVWQTEQNLHTLPELGDLVGHIRSATRSALEFQKVSYEGFEITGCWANIALYGGWHKAHSHPNNFLSGVYYVQARPGANRISFSDPRIQRQVISPHVSELDETNAGEVTLEVEEGVLLLFPAWLVHSVGFNTSDAERVSVSFNIMFSSFAETISHPRWRPNVKPGD